MKNIYFLVSIILILICTFISFYNFQSLRLQSDLLKEFNQNSYTDETLAKVLDRKDKSIPNISVTAMPLKVFYARYYHLSNQNSVALAMLDKPENDNPYLYTYETLKATIFQSLGVNDSANYYSKIAFEGLPGNAVNFELYIKSLVRNRDLEAIKEAFERVTIKENSQFWQIYFASVLNLKSENDTLIKKQALVAKKMFPNDKKLQIVSDFVLYGQKNIEDAVKINDTALTFFNNKDYENSFLYFNKASELNPADFTFHENAGVSLFQQKKHKEAIPYFRFVIDSLKAGNGKSEYLLGLCLYQIGNQTEACKYLRKSAKVDFKAAFLALSENCK